MRRRKCRIGDLPVQRLRVRIRVNNRRGHSANPFFTHCNFDQTWEGKTTIKMIKQSPMWVLASEKTEQANIKILWATKICHRMLLTENGEEEEIWRSVHCDCVWRTVLARSFPWFCFVFFFVCELGRNGRRQMLTRVVYVSQLLCTCTERWH